MNLTPVKPDTINQELADKLAKKYKKEDAGSSDGLPQLKINYSDQSTTAKVGEWVVGQKKNQEGTITEHGDAAKAFIAIIMRNAYSYYDSKNTSNNCSSPLFVDYTESVKGSTHKHICGKKTCPYAAEGKCKAQKVVFGAAITKNSGLVDCVGYFSGVSYMPVSDYMAAAQKMSINNITRKVPPFSYIASLSSKSERNGAITYFIPVIKREWVVSKDEDIEMLERKRDEILRMIDIKATEKSDTAYTDLHVQNTRAADPDEVMDASFEELKREFAGTDTDKEPPENEISSSSPEDIDLEAEIRNALDGI